MKFTVLLSIYAKEDAKYFHRCMQSIWDEQTLKPAEILLVQDGQLTENLYNVIQHWEVKLFPILKIVVLKKNVGLGKALNIGLTNCSHELVARMDTDDISHPERFEIQTNFLHMYSKVDIIGSQISEFNNLESNITSYRKVPHSHDEIKYFSKKRNPLNHPSVMYRKKSVIKAGNYLEMPGFEDYYLWVRMLLSGSQIVNIPQTLVNMRAGHSLIKRRGGLKYIQYELIFQKKLLHLNFINHYEYYQNISIRVLARIIPNNLRSLVYTFIRR